MTSSINNDPTSILNYINSRNKILNSINQINIYRKEYDFKNPSLSIPNLVKAYAMVQLLENEHWKTIKTEELKKLMN